MRSHLSSLATVALVAAVLVALTATSSVADSPDEAPPARLRDPAVDRGLLSAHAETIGAGRWSINSYELALISVTCGFTDDFQLSLTTFIPFPPLQLSIGIGAKYVLSRGSRYVVSLRGTFGVAGVAGADRIIIGGLGGVGAVADLYFDEKQRHAFHAGVLVGGYFNTNTGEDGLNSHKGSQLLGLEAGFTMSLSRGIKLLVETQILIKLGQPATVGWMRTKLINYGLRFHGHSVALDVGMVRPIGDVELGS